MGRVARGSTAWRPAAAATLLLAAGGCGGSGLLAPDRLSDGSTPPALPAALKGIEGAVMTGTRTLHGRDLEDAPAVDCIKNMPGGAPPLAAVEAVTVDGHTLTFSTADRQRLVACDGAARRRPSRRWCGTATTRWLGGGGIEDPRLDLANCLTADGATVAYTWVVPPARARWLVVDHDHFREVYDAGSAYPVRVSTTDGIDVKTSSATIHVRSYDAAGKEVGDDTVNAQVAG
ncbi:MAG TPA: hypothetical protein VFU10_00510 [Gaiellaceae bacterium]|nr:hypothetical protein [Gaiellaceae bacterium]